MNTTPAGQQPPTIPVVGAWQPLPNAGAAPQNTDHDTKTDWTTRILLAAVMAAALSVGTWSIYTLLTVVFHAPKGIALLGCGMFDGAALLFARLSQKYAVTTDSGIAPRFAMLLMVATSSWINWQHGQLEGWGTVGSVILASAPAVAEIAFEMWHRYEHRATLRRLGRVAQTLPVLGKWAWLMHPMRSRKTIDAHIKAALTEHEAVADRREEVAGVRARMTVSLPIPAAEVSPMPEVPMQVSLERLETSPAETNSRETRSLETAETQVSRRKETSETETSIREGDRSPETSKARETSETETGLRVSPSGLPRETTQVTAIGDRETEIQDLLSLMKSRGGHMQVSLNDAIETTGRPKATAAKRLKNARDLYLAETA
ncbi:hypothetical protein AB0M00_43450 [Streptomyces chartreusis]|uniref:hypothetical protein n=1 Tax=Streptomyces chartreusis TaxID=1969 RepID=UPI00343E1744